MKSIHTKIAGILVIGFLFQVIITGTFYQFVLTKKIIYEINNSENSRQSMLNGAIDQIEKMGNNVPKIQSYLLQYSQTKNVDFKIKDMNGNIVYLTSFTDNMSRKIQERAFIEFNDKPVYVVYAYFPTKIKSIVTNVQGGGTGLALAFIVFSSALIISFIIYLVIGAPLKKLRKAMGNINYGNTEVNIPYFANDEIGLLCRNMEEMGKRLKKSEDDQNNLIQAISHDLKTPLTSILGYVNRLSDGKVSDDNKRDEYYEIIQRKSNDMKGLIEELEDFSNIFKAGKYDMIRVDLKRFVEDISYELKYEVNQRGKGFESYNNMASSYSIIIDEYKIRRVFSNIIGNSLKYAGDNASIAFSCLTKGNHALFEICDNGIGVSPEEMDRIFDRFYRVDASRSREMGGTGLGLAICKDIIESHGGEIYARANPEGGLCICFSIPLIVNVQR